MTKFEWQMPFCTFCAGERVVFPVEILVFRGKQKLSWQTAMKKISESLQGHLLAWFCQLNEQFL